jgi:hypothetical protein
MAEMRACTKILVIYCMKTLLISHSDDGKKRS